MHKEEACEDLPVCFSEMTDRYGIFLEAPSRDIPSVATDRKFLKFRQTILACFLVDPIIRDVRRYRVSVERRRSILEWYFACHILMGGHFNSQ